MSWDVYVARFDNVHRSVLDVPDDGVAIPLGPAARVREQISAVFPGTDWTEPAWGMWAGPDGSVEFNIGHADPVTGFMLHVRAGGIVVAGIIELAEMLKGQAFDAGHGDLLQVETDGSNGSLTAWRDYRDHILAGPGSAPS